MELIVGVGLVFGVAVGMGQSSTKGKQVGPMAGPGIGVGIGQSSTVGKQIAKIRCCSTVWHAATGPGLPVVTNNEQKPTCRSSIQLHKYLTSNDSAAHDFID